MMRKTQNKKDNGSAVFSTLLAYDTPICFMWLNYCLDMRMYPITTAFEHSKKGRATGSKTTRRRSFLAGTPRPASLVTMRNRWVWHYVMLNICIFSHYTFHAVSAYVNTFSKYPYKKNNK